jgi:acetyltransferase-like isoleucine patch superfamily enzyme
MSLGILERIKFWKSADRIGPDIPYTHWRLYFKPMMKKLCKSKFKYFDDTAEFRPGAYAVGCSKISIGKRCVVRPATMLFADSQEKDAGITIENDVLIGSGVHIYIGNHRFDNPRIPIIDQGHNKPEGVVLKKGCWIGANCIILPGVIVGENAVVGAGAVVTKNVPDKAVAAGNPARILKEIRSQTD